MTDKEFQDKYEALESLCVSEGEHELQGGTLYRKGDKFYLTPPLYEKRKEEFLTFLNELIKLELFTDKCDCAIKDKCNLFLVLRMWDN